MTRDIDRDEFGRAIAALLNRNRKENERTKLRLCEELSLPYDCGEHKRSKELMPLMVGPFTSFFLKEIEEDTLITLAVNSIIEKAKTEGEILIEEDENIIITITKKIFSNIVSKIMPGGSWEIVFRYIDEGIQLSEKYQKPLEEIFASDLYDLEILRLIYGNIEEFQKAMNDMVSKAVQVDTILELYLQPIAEFEGIPQEEIDELVIEIQENDALINEFEKMKEATLKILDEKAHKIYGGEVKKQEK